MAINTSRSLFLHEMDTSNKLWAEWETGHMHLGDCGCLAKEKQKWKCKEQKVEKVMLRTYIRWWLFVHDAYKQADLSVHHWVPVEKLR